jgi:hypothetical protein
VSSGQSFKAQDGDGSRLTLEIHINDTKGAPWVARTENVRLADSDEHAVNQPGVELAAYPHQGSCPIHTTIIPRPEREVKKKTMVMKTFSNSLILLSKGAAGTFAGVPIGNHSVSSTSHQRYFWNKYLFRKSL